MTKTQPQQATAAASHKYRIELPNLIDEMRLSPFEVALYVHVKRRAGDGGVCNESTRELAEACRMSVGQVSAAKKELLRRGLIGVRRVKRQDILYISDIWQENYQHFAPREAERAPAEDRSPGEQIVHPVNRSFTTRTDRSLGEQIVHMVNVPPDPLIRIEEPLQEPSERTTQELSLSPAAAGDSEKGREVVSSWKTKFTLEQVLSTARAKGMGDGWVTEALDTGKHDWQVAQHLNPPLPLPPVAAVLLNPKDCPDCDGTGFRSPAGRGKGVVRCQHDGLLAKLKARAERERDAGTDEARGSPAAAVG